MAIATLIAGETFESASLSDARDRLHAAGCDIQAIDWIETDKAVDIGFEGDLATARSALAPLETVADIAVQSGEHRRKMLLVSDMDSTIITVECIDELADYAGIKPQIAEITERAMQGELDFRSALRERVALLKGLDRSVIARCIAERVRLTPGADVLIATMRGWGAKSLLVSGGFTPFVSAVADMVGFDASRANVLGFDGDALSGTVEGEIVDADAKARQLVEAQSRWNVRPAETMAMGDGANDIPMVEAAISGGGLGVAFRPKPALAAAANVVLRHNDLSTMLYVQGVARRDWLRG